MGKKVICSILLTLIVSLTAAQQASAQPSQKDYEDHLLQRWKIMLASLGELSAPADNDKAENFLDELKYDSLIEMDQKQLTQGSVSQRPWSDSYWPYYTGILANRYADRSFPRSRKWEENNDYILKNLGLGDVENLSPAEKYDLLLGNKDFSLTKAMLQESGSMRGENGEVEAWMGICHGWAAAAIMLDRPSKKIEVTTPNGTKIPFYPSDIKALASLLWANAEAPNRFIGGRCDEKNPRKDRRGRPINLDCLDSNPATWHLAVVNQLGFEKRSFVMDATYDYQVWNHPLVSYKYSYVNPRTGENVDSLQKALVKRVDFPEDKYRTVRARGTDSIVGINMILQYAAENSPVARDRDNESYDVTSTVRYQYDLELDQDGRIIGGEWHTLTHPDFLWQPIQGREAISEGDRNLNNSGDRETWTRGKPVPHAWTNAGIQSSTQSQPLARIVNALIHFSND